jgi:outer membrane lipoprotein SlyB
MNTTVQTTESPRLLIWFAGIAVILISGVGIAAIMGWIPTSMGRTADGIATSAPYKQTSKSAASLPPQARANTEPRTAPARAAERAAARVHCGDCGVIESMREVSTKGTGSGVGAVGGAVVGGLLGNQIGAGRGNTVATAIGAVGGAVAGNEVEKRVKATKAYEVTVRLDDGSSHVVSEQSASAWQPGDRVKIVSGALQSIP